MTINFAIPGRIGGKGRGAPMKASDEQIARAYAATGSVWTAARSLGMCGQSLHERLQRLGLSNPRNVFTAADDARLTAEYDLYASTGRLTELAASMGRTKSFLCRQARRLGLTRTKRPKPYLAESIAVAAKARIARCGHPRGMLGKKHTAKTAAAVSKASTARWQAMTKSERNSLVLRMMQAKAERGPLAGHQSAARSWKAGWRTVGRQRCFFRSQWESNYGCYLEWLRANGDIQGWEHEPKTFWFEKIKRGVRSYLPDFRVTENDGKARYHEVKGWMDARSKTAIARFRRYYPTETLIVIDAKAYRKLDGQLSRLVPGWGARPESVPITYSTDAKLQPFITWSKS